MGLDYYFLKLGSCNIYFYGLIRRKSRAIGKSLALEKMHIEKTLISSISSLVLDQLLPKMASGLPL
jgi:hypothetical protein